jgi:hypothetical protein
MEGNPTAQPNSNPSGPEAASGAAESMPASERVSFNGQEMEVNDFLKSRKHRVKVDGKESEVDFDELVKGYSHGAAANARMREAAEAKKQLQEMQARERQLLEHLKKPDSLFELAKKAGVDVEGYAHDLVLKKYQYEMMTPEERERFHEKQELESYRDRERKEAEAKKAQELEQYRQQAVTDLETNIVKHLESLPSVPSPAVVGRAIDAMIEANHAGVDLSIEDAFKKANGWFEKERKSIFDAELRALLESGEVPKELAEAVRKKDLAALRREPPKRTTPVAQAQKEKPLRNMDDFFNDLERKYTK